MLNILDSQVKIFLFKNERNEKGLALEMPVLLIYF